MFMAIDSRLIQNLVGFDVNGATEYKCLIKCPVCEKLTHANYKAYIVGSRTRKNAKKPVESSRKAAWYFSSLQTHLLNNHIGDEISDEVYEETRDDSNGDKIEPEIDMNEKDKTNEIAQNDFPISENAMFGSVAQGIIIFDPYNEDSNSATNASLPQTPKKRIVTRFFEQLRQNKQDHK